VRCAESPSVGCHKVTLTVDATGLPANSEVSFRFAVSRTDGDIADAAADAQGNALALVFVDDKGRNVVPEAAPLPRLPKSSCI
jgi:hypothetical protein